MQPRHIRPGITYLLTRRCIERRFLLRPSPKTNQIVQYCLALAAERTGMQLHAFCAMSNHIHTVATDVEGRLPEFLQFFHRHLAVAINASLGRVGNLWAGTQSSAVELGSATDVLDKLAYVVGNPTTAGLVRAPQRWPGVISRRMGETYRVKRPVGYFRVEGVMPEYSSLTYSVPPQLDHLGVSQVNELFFKALSNKVRVARKALQERGKSFLGAKQVSKTEWSQVAFLGEKCNAKVPRFAIRDPQKYREALVRWRGFLTCYIDALRRWRGGDRSVTFPDGTWWMKRGHCANCGPPGTVVS